MHDFTHWKRPAMFSPTPVFEASEPEPRLHLRFASATAGIALAELKTARLIIDCNHEVFDRKHYWNIHWRGEDNALPSAIGATQYKDDAGVPFGIQRDLLRRGIVTEVVLLCKAWKKHFYRIPASEFLLYDITLNGRRCLFHVYSDNTIHSAATLTPIQIERFRRSRV